MANEAVIIELLGNKGDPVRYTVIDGATIEKGTIMEMEDNRTAKKISGANKPIAGIAAAEKVANDGSTTLAVYTNGIFDLTVGSGQVTVVGSDVVSNGSDNTIDTFDTLDDELGYVIGKSLETGGNSEVVAIRILL